MVSASVDDHSAWEPGPAPKAKAAPKSGQRPPSSAARKRANVERYSSSYTNLAAFPVPCHCVLLVFNCYSYSLTLFNIAQLIHHYSTVLRLTKP